MWDTRTPLGPTPRMGERECPHLHNAQGLTWTQGRPEGGCGRGRPESNSISELKRTFGSLPPRGHGGPTPIKGLVSGGAPRCLVLPTNLLTGRLLPARRGQSLPGREAGGHGSEWPAPLATRLSEGAQCPRLLQTRPPEPRCQLCDPLPGVGGHPPLGLAAPGPRPQLRDRRDMGRRPSLPLDPATARPPFRATGVLAGSCPTGGGAGLPARRPARCRARLLSPAATTRGRPNSTQRRVPSTGLGGAEPLGTWVQGEPRGGTEAGVPHPAAGTSPRSPLCSPPPFTPRVQEAGRGQEVTWAGEVVALSLVGVGQPPASYSRRRPGAPCEGACVLRGTWGRAGWTRTAWEPHSGVQGGTPVTSSPVHGPLGHGSRGSAGRGSLSLSEPMLGRDGCALCPCHQVVRTGHPHSNPSEPEVCRQVLRVDADTSGSF